MGWWDFWGLGGIFWDFSWGWVGGCFLVIFGALRNFWVFVRFWAVWDKRFEKRRLSGLRCSSVFKPLFFMCFTDFARGNLLIKRADEREAKRK